MKPSGIALICLLLMACAAASSAVMDTLSFRYGRSIFPKQENLRQWWDPAISWKNKWADGNPKNGEAFPLSSTALVATTDAWHFFKTAMISFFLIAVILPFTRIIRASKLVWVGVFLGLHLLWGLTFETLFAHILIR